METKNKNNAYKVEVLQVNAALKVAKPTFAGALKTLNVLLPGETPKKITEVIKTALKNEQKFNELKGLTRCTKNGKYSPFFILQAIYRINKK